MQFQTLAIYEASSDSILPAGPLIKTLSTPSSRSPVAAERKENGTDDQSSASFVRPRARAPSIHVRKTPLRSLSSTTDQGRIDIWRQLNHSECVPHVRASFHYVAGPDGHILTHGRRNENGRINPVMDSLS